MLRRSIHAFSVISPNLYGQTHPVAKLPSELVVKRLLATRSPLSKSYRRFSTSNAEDTKTIVRRMEEMNATLKKQMVDLNDEVQLLSAICLFQSVTIFFTTLALYS
jgi:hypothetical protein